MNGIFSPDAESIAHSRSQSRAPTSAGLSREASGSHTNDSTRGMNRVNWVYFILGSATLLSWNAVITAFPFFLSRLSDPALKNTFPSYFSAVYQLVSLVCLAHASSTAAQASKHSRITFSYLGLTITLILLFTSTFIPSPSILFLKPSTVFFLFALSVGAFQASAGTYLLSAVVAYAAYFGPLTMQSVMSGQAAVGVTVSVVQLVIALSTAWTKRPNETPKPGGDPNQDANLATSASYFFFLATLGLLGSYFAYRKLTKMRLFKKTVAKFEDRTIGGSTAEYSSLPMASEDDIPPPLEQNHSRHPTFDNESTENVAEDDDDESDLMAMSTSLNSLRERERELGMTVETRLDQASERRPILSQSPTTVHPHPDLEIMGEIEPPLQLEKAGFWHVWRVNKMYNIAVAGIYIVTLSVFPPITSSIRSVDPTTNPQIFVALHFVVFNISDWIGRYICSYPFFQIWSRKKLLALSMSRIVFVVLFLLCNVNLRPGPPSAKRDLLESPLSIQARSWPPRSPADTPIINSDLLFFALLSLFGMSNGWLTSLIMMAAPSLEQNKRMRREWVDWAAVGASFSLGGGLVIGSASAFALRGVMCGCNPFIG